MDCVHDNTTRQDEQGCLSHRPVLARSFETERSTCRYSSETGEETFRRKANLVKEACGIKPLPLLRSSRFFAHNILQNYLNSSLSS